ncbi:transporter, putative [Plasmodium gallinaceum]|uniref:Transporter, putative n=1 Tax=Plasmodium gallinaceum TaxID=5849 RepID=A0A1J1GVX1_PLAGA|nr:transporter, putative [Plasmodium gallinaceum]CRG96696.1 transporter, putative [Plasmodium gallinaceum]
MRMESTEDIKEDISSIISKEEINNNLKINRWVCLALYSIVASVATFVHSGFSGWQPIIFKTGAFKELCTPDDEVQIFRVDANITYESCGNRDAAVNNLSTLSFFVHFFLSFSSGYILDTYGEKVCFLCGQTILTAAFLSLILFKVSYIWYVFFFLLGVSADLSFIPLLKISKFFPGKESLIFGILGSARSTGFAIGLVLKLVFFYTFNFKDDEFYILCIFYILTCSMYSLIIGIFIMPGKSEDISHLNSEGATGSSVTDKNHVGVLNEMESLESIEKKNKKDVNETFGEKLRRLWSHPKKWEYLLVVFICSSNMIRFDYFIKTNRSFFIWRTYDLTTIFSLLTILSFIPSPFFGYIAGKFGSVYGILINNIFVLLTYIFVLFDSVYLRAVSILLFFFFISFAFSCFYCYVDEKYSKEHFGKLCGLMFAVSALCLVVNFYLTYLTNVVYVYLGEKKQIPVTIGLIILGLITILGCIYLKISERVIEKEFVPEKKKIVDIQQN